MSITQSRPPVEVRERPRSAGPRRRTPGDQSLGVLLTVYLVLLLAAGVSAAFLAHWMRSAS